MRICVYLYVICVYVHICMCMYFYYDISGIQSGIIKTETPKLYLWSGNLSHLILISVIELII